MTQEELDEALLKAAQAGNVPWAEKLILQGAKVDAIGHVDAGWQPLHYAAYYGHKELVELLIAKDAKVDAGTVAGRRPLHFAAIRDCREAVKSLVEHGADPTALDDDGQTPRDNCGLDEEIRTFLQKAEREWRGWKRVRRIAALRPKGPSL